MGVIANRMAAQLLGKTVSRLRSGKTYRIQIVYSTITGNTEKLARYLADTLRRLPDEGAAAEPERCRSERQESNRNGGLGKRIGKKHCEIDVLDISRGVDEIPEADLYLMAFWCRHTGMDDRSLEFLQHLSGQVILAVGTIGGDAAGAYGRKVERNVKTSIEEENTCLGVRVCQGAVNLERSRRRLELPAEDPHSIGQEKFEKHLKTQGHPTEAELQDMAAFVREMVLEIAE